MRTIHFFRKTGDSSWVSPNSLWAALSSDEEIRIVRPPDILDDSLVAASQHAAENLVRGWIVDIKNSGISALWCLAVVFGLLWPPLAAKMPKTVQEGFQAGFFGLFSLEMVYLMQIRRKIRILGQKMANLPEIFNSASKKLKLSPPAGLYYPETVFPSRKARYAIFATFLVILANIVVLAFPGRPAIVFPPQGGPYIIKRPQIVAPGTKWEWRQEWLQGSSVALIAVAPDEKTVWVARATYKVHHLYLLKEPGPWRRWAAVRLGWIVEQVSSSVWQSLPPEMKDAERIATLVEAFEGDEEEDMLAQIFREHFNEHHDGIMRLSAVHVEVVEISVGDYISIAQDQNKE